MDSCGVLAKAPRRFLRGMDFGDQPAHGRIPTGELDAGGLTDHAASSVAADEIFRPQRAAVEQFDLDDGIILRETGDLASAIGRHFQLLDPAGQDALDVMLPQSEYVVVPG